MLLVLGGGSNLVVADEGFPGTVIHLASRGLTTAPDGFRLSPYDMDAEKQIEAGREIMAEFRDTLKALAK